MTKEEIEFIQKNMTSGHVTHDELPDAVPEGETIPFVAVPNMPNGRSFSIDEIREVLRVNKEKESNDQTQKR